MLLLQNSRSGEGLGDAGGPFGGAGLVDAGAAGVYGYGDGHGLRLKPWDVELVDGFHAEFGECRGARLTSPPGRRREV